MYRNILSPTIINYISYIEICNNYICTYRRYSNDKINVKHGKMTGLASPNIDGIPHVKSPAVKDRLIAGILETDVLKEQYLPCENGYYRIEIC